MKKRPQLSVKSFRLFDFHFFDKFPERSEDETQNKTSTESAKFMIQMFGINEKGETCSLTVNDYNPFFYIKVGDNWTESDANELFHHFIKTIGNFGKSIIGVELVHHKKLYGFSGGKEHTFVKIVFENTIAMNKVKNLWYVKDQNDNRVRENYFYKNKNIRLELYESNIPPLLRYFHIQGVSPSGWVSISTNKAIIPKTKTTTCKYEYIISKNSVKPMPEKETRVPYKICSYDIEASSSHGDFPVPVKSYKTLATNIVDVFLIQQPSIDMAKRLLETIILTAFGYSKFEGVDLVYPKYEVTKEQLQKVYIAKLLKDPIDEIDKLNSEEANKILTISSMFESIKENFSSVLGYTETNNQDIDSDDENIPMENDTPIYRKSTNPKAKKVEKKQTIIDLLISTEYSRDETIQIVDRVFTKVPFPQLKGDEVTFIGSTFLNYGETKPYLNHCLVVGDCEEVEGAVIESVETEEEILRKWTQLIQTENPDIIIGYNIFGFDYEFMFQRSKETGCVEDFLKLSRIENEICAKQNADMNYEIENTKLAIASGEYDLRFIKMTGRLQVDMYSYFRRDFNLSSYKLDDVAGLYISDDIKKIKSVLCPHYGGECTELYSKNLAGLNVNDFIHIEITGFTTDYFKDGKKFVVVDIIKDREEIENIKGEEKVTKNNVIIIKGHYPELTEISKSVKWCIAKDDVTPQQIFALSKGSATDRAIVAKYCIQDCNLVHHLMNKIDVITGYIEMSSICSVPIPFLVFRGQGIKLTSYVAKKCREKNTLMPDVEKSGDNDGYEGAIVLPPKCSMYMDNPVACVDYSSLYPSSMISQNYSHDSKVWSKEYDLEGNLIRESGEKDKKGVYIYDNLPEYQYIDIEFDTFKYLRPKDNPKASAKKVKVGTKVCRWAQLPDNQKSIMPSILQELLKARSDTRKKQKQEADPFMWNILEKRQLGYKVTANSLYGQCGSKTSTFYEKDVAASTTATGRMMITYAKRMIEEVYGNRLYETETNGVVLTKAEYVYGDSVASYTPVYVRVNNSLDICTIEELAEKYGDGIWRQCVEPGKQEKEVCELTGVETWTERGWTTLYRVIRHVLAPHKKMVRILTHTGLVDVTDDHSLIKSDGTEISPNDCSVGTELLHRRQPLIIENNIIDIQTEEDETGNEYICFKGKSQKELAKIMNNLYYVGYLWVHISDNERIYLRPNKSENDIIPDAIKKIEPVEYEGYVYDLTTENHHFAAGIGNMIVHNTDSVFFTFNLEDPVTKKPIRGKKALEITIEIAQDAAHLCTDFLKPPMELSYEKTLMPFILLSKKRYVGMLYEEDPNKGKLKYMGLSLKRRDSCDYLKDVYGGILNILMKENDIAKAIEFLNYSLEELIKGNVPMDKLAITKALRSYYKNPKQIAHWVLSERIGKRDPGNKPKPGDRIKFIYFNNKDRKALQGDRIETPEFILEKKLKIDYNHYITNQLMKPLQQLFGLAVEKIWEIKGKTMAIKTYQKEVKQIELENPDYEVYMKKREKYCSAKIKTILFDGFLTKIANDKNGLRSIMDFI